MYICGIVVKNAYSIDRVRFRIPTRILNVFYLLELSFFKPKFVNNLKMNFLGLFLEAKKKIIGVFVREKYQDTPGSSSIYQNAPKSSKITKLPLCPRKYTL